MSTLKKRLEQVASGKSTNHPLIQTYLEDDNAEELAKVLLRLTQRQGRVAKRPPSSFLPLLD